MKIKAQLSMVMNLDKCLGCHTCSITCKNTWTNREGSEYMYFNNVETRPGTGYPREWENQDKWLGGWELNKGKPRLRSGAAITRLLKLFYNPEQPELNDYFEPWTYDYHELIAATRQKHQPVARPYSLVSGDRMEITWGPNWDDDLAGTCYARKDCNIIAANKKGETIRMDMQDLFMRHLPRICNHCLNPACVAACPSGAIYKRDEDGVVLVSQDICRGWRACVPACPYKKIFYNWKTNKAEKCIFCYPRLENGQPPICADTCVGRLRYMGVLLYDMDEVYTAAQTPEVTDLLRSAKGVIANPFDPAVQKNAREHGIAESWLKAAQNSPVYRLIAQWNLALPLHGEYRTLPMVYYIPPLSPILAHLAPTTNLGEADEMRIPVQYLAQLFSAGDPEPIKEVINALVAVRQHMRAKEVGDPEPACSLNPSTLDEMYHLLAIASYKQRFNIPATPPDTCTNCQHDQQSAGFTCCECKGGFAV